MKIGFIGLGRMGHHVAANLMKAGHEVTVWNRSQGPVEALVGKGAKAAKAPEDALQGDAVFSMLSNDQVMREVRVQGPSVWFDARLYAYDAATSVFIDPFDAGHRLLAENPPGREPP